MKHVSLTIFVGMAVLASACGGDEDADTCTVGTTAGCAEGRVCEAIAGSDQPACFDPIVVRGRVFDSATDASIANARIVALDINSFARSGVSFSEPDGTYALPVPAERNADGTPVAAQITLRVTAAGYEAFPTAPRTALPIDLASATGSADGRTIMNATTDVALVALEGGAAGLGTIRGTVSHDAPGGVLVVAEQGGNAVSTSIADANGDFVLYNVPNGTTELDGYREGLNVAGQTVEATGDVRDVVLAASGDGLATVSGNLSFVNPGSGITTVILAVASTFDPETSRAQAPAGLRAIDVTGAFTIEGVPPGSYYVLAAFENDGFVRDPDTSIGGTEIVPVTVPDGGGDISLDMSFKVTGALEVLSPGADGLEVITDTEPTFSWDDDSSEAGYEVYVFDALGNEVHAGELGPVTGSMPVTYTWTGAVTEPGMVYQFRAYSYRTESDGSRVYISATEDLLGVFTYAAAASM